MRTPVGARRSSRSMRHALPRLLVVVVLSGGGAAATGCATMRATMSGYSTGPNGIATPQFRFRRALMDGNFVKAFAWRDDDALLQSLTMGAAAFYAKQYARSAAVLDTAALLADDRITASVSRNGLALVTNDMARPYQARRTERLFIPYYAMLAYVQLGAWEDAAVEARRVVSLLAQYGEDRRAGERDVHGAMQHLAGAVFERSGALDDARVAYRAAHALRAALPEASPDGSDTSDGELLLVVERGFVAHRTTETFDALLDGNDRDSLRLAGDGHRRAASRIAEQANASTTHGPSSVAILASATSGLGDRTHRDDDANGDDYHVTVAYPALRRSPRPWGGALRVAIDDRVMDGMEVSAVIDDASAADADRERVSIAVRAIARAAAKYAVTKAVEEKSGKVMGRIANVGSAMLERADVRSWHVLPQEITLLRVRVPAGTRAVRVQVGDGSAVRTVEIGDLVLRSGELTIVPVRLWRDPLPPR
ncbi:MAG: hypothetical protein ABIV10_04700 [Gemmatimonadaceae bacterium]